MPLTTLAIGVIGFAAGALVALIYARSRAPSGGGSHEAAGLVYESWRARRDEVGGWMVGLQNRYPLVFGSPELGERLSGETAETFRVVAEEVDGLVRRLAAAHGLAERCGALLAGPAEGREERAAETLGLLGAGEIVLDDSTVPPERLLLPEHPPRRMRADELLAVSDGDRGEVARLLGILEAALHEPAEALRGVLDTLSAARKTLDGLPVARVSFKPYLDELDEQREAWAVLWEALETDPLGLRAELEDLEERSTQLAERVERLAETSRILASAVDGPLGAAWGEIQGLRGRGLRFDEPGHEPETLVQAATRHAAEARRLAAEGLDAGALEKARAARDAVEELDRVLRITVRVRDEGGGELRSLEERLASLEAREPERARRLGDLAASHAQSALAPATENVAEAHAAFPYVKRATRTIEQHLDGRVQRYMHAARDLEHLEGVIGQLEALYDEIETKAKELAAAEREAREELSEADETTRTIEGLLAREGRFASADLVYMVRRIRDQLDEEARAQGVERPDWPARLQRATALALRATSLDNWTRQEQEAMSLFADRLLEVWERRAKVIEILASVPEIDQRVKVLYDAASATVDTLEPLSKNQRVTGIDWMESLARLKRAAVVLDEMGRIHDPEASPAGRARQSLARVPALLLRVDRDYGRGIAAELDPARTAWGEARRSLGHARYAEAAAFSLQAQDLALEAEWMAVIHARFAEARAIADDGTRLPSWAGRPWWKLTVD